MKEKALVYLKGLGFTYLALIIFSAVGWIKIADVFTVSKIVIPLLMALVIWTAMYFLSYAVWTLLALLASCTFGIGLLIGLGVLGYVAMRLAAFILPIGWVTFTDDQFALFLMGGSIALVDIIIDEEKRTRLSMRVSKNKEDED